MLLHSIFFVFLKEGEMESEGDKILNISRMVRRYLYVNSASRKYNITEKGGLYVYSRNQ